MLGKEEKILNKLEVAGTLLQRGIKHFATHPKMSMRYLSESLTQIRALMKFIAPEGRT